MRCDVPVQVTNSLGALARSLVYCTEPYRISFAGRLDAICFDKTGTLTKDQMLLRGLCAPADLPLFVPAGASPDRMGAAATTPSAADTDTDANGAASSSSSSDLLLGDLSAAREAVLNTAEASDLVLAAMGCCHDLMVPTIVGAGSDLLGTVRALQYAGVLREMTLSC
jgi:magnesium-transporting ATPase (P-type)